MKHLIFLGIFLCSTYSLFSQASDSISSDDGTFILVHKTASFPGGQRAWAEYLSKNLTYPDDAKELGIEGRVFVQFIVERDGKLTNIKVVKGIGGGCDEEAVRLLRESPNWIPGALKDDEYVRQKYIQNILFKKPKKLSRKNSEY